MFITHINVLVLVFKYVRQQNSTKDGTNSLCLLVIMSVASLNYAVKEKERYGLQDSLTSAQKSNCRWKTILMLRFLIQFLFSVRP